MTDVAKEINDMPPSKWEQIAEEAAAAFAKEQEEKAQQLELYIQDGFESDFEMVKAWLDKHGSFTDDGLAYKCIEGVEELLERGFDCEKMLQFESAMAVQSNQGWIEEDECRSWMVHRGIIISTIFGQGSSTLIGIASDEDIKEFNRKRTVENLGKIVLAKGGDIMALYVDGKLAMNNPDMNTMNALLSSLGIEHSEKTFDAEWLSSGPGTPPEELHDAKLIDDNKDNKSNNE